MAADERKEVLQEVRGATKEMAALLEDFSGRLRRMRQRNRQLEEEIVSFEDALLRLKEKVLDVTPDE